MRHSTMAATFGALLFALPVAAEDFAPPKGCETFLTVQSKLCSVSLVWRCDVSPGNQWEATFGPGGLESVVSYSDNYQWLDSVYLWDESREEFSPPATDPIELDALLDTGFDTYDFIMRRTEGGRASDLRMVGADQLTGKTALIDGYTLDLVATELQILKEDGSVEYHSRGVQYLSRELGQFFLGTETVFEPDGAVNDYDGSPVDIILPGEPGFGGTLPLYDCAEQEAGLNSSRGTANAG